MDRFRKGLSRRTFYASTALVAVALVAGVAWQRTSAQRPPMAEDVFTNVQVLKGIPVDEFMGTMGFFSASLGLNCTDCHIAESGGNWSRYADDNARKRMSRVMMQMVREINGANFNGRPVVTCYTCHRGVTRPGVMPSLDALYSPPAGDEPGDPFPQAPGEPPPTEILDRYIAAVGGQRRAEALTGLRLMGAYTGFDDPEGLPVELVLTALPQRSSTIHTLSGESRTVLDRGTAWITAPSSERPLPVFPITGSDLAGLTLENVPFFPARIKESLTNWRSGYPKLLGDRPVAVVQGTMAVGGVATFCFDAESGLLVRLVRYGNSPVGRIVTRVDYEDYREVNGVKIPSKWTTVWLDGRGHYEIRDAQANPSIDANLFARPPQASVLSH